MRVCLNIKGVEISYECLLRLQMARQTLRRNHLCHSLYYRGGRLCARKSVESRGIEGLYFQHIEQLYRPVKVTSAPCIGNIAPLRMIEISVLVRLQTLYPSNDLRLHLVGQGRSQSGVGVVVQFITVDKAGIFNYRQSLARRFKIRSKARVDQSAVGIIEGSRSIVPQPRHPVHNVLVVKIVECSQGVYSVLWQEVSHLIEAMLKAIHRLSSAGSIQLVVELLHSFVYKTAIISVNLQFTAGDQRCINLHRLGVGKLVHRDDSQHSVLVADRISYTIGVGTRNFLESKRACRTVGRADGNLRALLLHHVGNSLHLYTEVKNSVINFSVNRRYHRIGTVVRNYKRYSSTL